MKYYLYISDAKLNMLYPQLPQKLFDRFTAELEANVHMVKGGLKWN